MAIYGIIFSQKQFYGIVGHVDESQNNGLSNDNQKCNKIHPFTNSSSIVCQFQMILTAILKIALATLKMEKFKMANEKISIRKD